jgi:protein archease
MPFRFLPDVALADIAFEAEATTLDGLFEACALALSDIMVAPETVEPKVSKTISVDSEETDTLLYDFLTEIIVIKDVDSLLFRDVKVEVAADGKSLNAVFRGEKIDRERHELRNDVKAVTMHMFGVKHEGGKWRATVVLDI